MSVCCESMLLIREFKFTRFAAEDLYYLCGCFTLLVEFQETVIIFDLLYFLLFYFCVLFSDVNMMQAN
jgi:hypothetical protein